MQKQFEGAHGRKAPDQIGYNPGNTFPVPQNSIGPFPTRGAGMMYMGGQGGNGLHPSIWGVRHMDANNNRGSSVTYFRSNGQSADPLTGRTLSKSDPAWHLNPFHKNY